MKQGEEPPELIPFDQTEASIEALLREFPGGLDIEALLGFGEADATLETFLEAEAEPLPGKQVELDEPGDVIPVDFAAKERLSDPANSPNEVE